MATARKTAKKENFALALELGGSLARLTTGFLPDGSYVFEDTLDIKGTLTAPVITGGAWLCELYALEGGAVAFVSGAGYGRPRSRRFAVFYPPFTIAQPAFDDARGRVVGVAGLAPVPAGLATTPRLVDIAFEGRPACAAEVFELIAAGQAPQAVPFNPCPSLLSAKAKRLIDENYLVYPSLARIAARLGVTAAHLSRQFKRDFAMTPSAYLRQVRVADAPLRLARGDAIADVSQEVGYNDLSRFYKQFRATMSTSPGACQGVVQPD